MMFRRGYWQQPEWLIIVAILALLIGILMPIFGFLWTLIIIFSGIAVLYGLALFLGRRRIKSHEKDSEWYNK